MHNTIKVSDDRRGSGEENRRLTKLEREASDNSLMCFVGYDIS
jgi:hypothetical protein